MDLSHSGWSDIFFLGMDFPQGARVLNVSIDLGVRGRDAQPQPPIEAWLRVIDQPVLRLTSIDLKCKADITALADVFDFAKDYLGLLKAAVIAAGIIPSGLEGSGQTLADVLARLVGPGLGLEIVSKVNDIPKGSRLAVSTNLLAAIITVCMRATGQIQSLTGTLSEAERKLVAARAILGEWLGGSGGGWQDSGGIWPGMKMIEGRAAQPGDPEYGISLGRLLPDHHIYTAAEVSPQTRQLICDSFVLVHGGMAQNVGPVLEMVTEKYLLRSEAEWTARQEAIELLREIEKALAGGDVREIARLTTRNFFGPIQTIIPWASNHYTETLIDAGPRQVRRRLLGLPHAGRHFRRRHGVHLRSGAKGRGPGFPRSGRWSPRSGSCRPRCPSPWTRWSTTSPSTTAARRPSLYEGGDAMMPAAYYAICAPEWLRQETRQLSPAVRNEITRFAAACRTHPRLAGSTEMLLGALFPRPQRRRRRQWQPEIDPRGQRLRSRTARADPLRSADRADRPGPEPPAAQHGHRGRGLRRRGGHRSPTGLDDGRAAGGRGGLGRRAKSPCWPWPAGRAAAGPAGRAWSRPCILSAASRASIAISSRSTWPRAARPPPVSAPRCPIVVSTSYLTHEPIEQLPAIAAGQGLSRGRWRPRRAVRSGCG